MSRATHLVLTPLYPPIRFGGIEKIVRAICQGISALGDDVRVVAGAGYPAGVASQDGPQVHWAAERSHSDDPLSRAYQYAVVETALNALDTSVGDLVIHAHDWFVAPAAQALAARLDAPILAVFHSDKRTEYPGVLDNRRRAIHTRQVGLAHAAARVVCYSEYLRERVACSTGRDMSDIELFRCGFDPVRPDDSIERGTDLLYLGRLAQEKGVDVLVRAFRQVRDAGHDVRLRIVGAGDAERSLVALAISLGIGDFVAFHPFTSDEQQVDTELRRAAALVLPSVFEPFGLVLLEAMSRGLPVIACNGGGPTEIVTDGVTGRLFEVGDVDDLATVLKETLRDPSRASALAARGFEQLREIYKWEAAAVTVRDIAHRALTLTGSATA